MYRLSRRAWGRKSDGLEWGAVFSEVTAAMFVCFAMMGSMSARAAQAQGTWKAGLATVVEVAEAQRLLTQAEIDDSLAKLAVWRALLGVAAAQGDLEPFLKQVR